MRFFKRVLGAPVLTLCGLVTVQVTLDAQTASVSKEYIRLAGRVIAIENPPGNARQFATTAEQVNWGDITSGSPLRIVGDMSLGMWIKLPNNAQGALFRAGVDGVLNDSTAWPYFMSIAGSCGLSLSGTIRRQITSTTLPAPSRQRFRTTSGRISGFRVTQQGRLTRYIRAMEQASRPSGHSPILEIHLPQPGPPLARRRLYRCQITALI